jgi:heterodisulfide reductase subunit A
MVSVGQHENIELLSYSQVEEVSGYVGNFKVKVRKKPRYVDGEKCTSCGLCWEYCLTKRIPRLKLIKKGEMSVGERRPGEK